MCVNPNHIPYGDANEYAGFLAGVRAIVEEEAGEQHEAPVVRQEGWALVSSLIARLNASVTVYGADAVAEPQRHPPVEVEPGPWWYLPGVSVPIPPDVSDAAS